MELLDYFGFFAVGEDVRDQGDPLVQSERMIDQALPCWSVAAREKRVKSTYAGLS